MVESSFNSDYYEDDQNKKSFLSKIKLVIGATSLVFSFIIFFSLLSYFFTGFDDQSLINPGVSFSTFGEEARNWLGVFGAFIGHYFIYVLFGVSSFILVPFLLIISFQFLFNIKLYSLGKTFIVTIFSIIWISTSMGFFLNIFPDSFILRNYTGGIGYGLAILLDNLLGYSSILILLLSLFIFVVFYFDLYSFSFISSTKLNSSKDFDTTDTETSEDTIIADDFEEEVGNNIVEEEEIKIDNAEKIEEIKDIKINKEDSEEDDLELKVEETLDEKTSSAKIGTVYDPELDLSNYKYPKVDLLNESTREKIQVTKDELTSNKNRIIETLKNFKIDIAKIKATIGPTVTLYEIVPEAGVKISKIKNLEDDIALSLSALGIRIIAPIPGKGTIGIEVPNKNREVVSLRSVMRTEKFIKNDFELPLILGKTISNEVFLADLTKMPHVLVAGATGQGKSVGLNVMLSSLLFKKHPSSLKFVLIDPKKVELSLFNKIERHFLAKLPDAEEPIITETKKVVHTLNSLCTEMDVRYNLLKDAQARNLKEYNKKFINRKLNPKEGHRYLPYIVLVIDELADLMMTAGKEIETPIARLAQLARAIGIHLIVATQRPSVNVITGVIKANFPTRISFKVTSNMDSRTILDSKGAEQLVGMGDMLYSPGSDIIRLQCPFVDTPEIEKICDHVGSQRGYVSAYLLPEYIDENEKQISDIDLTDRDPLFEDAARLIVSSQTGSTSLLQRKLKLGYNRAGRLTDQLEVAGIVGPSEGSKPRKVLIQDEYGLEKLLNDLG
ncbi:MAG: cell division protein FtsK [Flammeovirgaceae bacterium]|nr:cell division protein FtsK [Flammeovirgaceae bacterium]|tara:strand:- start:2913 stop:5261 length:2349 start_codon:yes stop_codon:yes gene_type:complete